MKETDMIQVCGSRRGLAARNRGGQVNTKGLAWIAVFAVALFVHRPGSAVAGEPAKAAEPAMVLDQARGSFRAFMTWRTPTLVTADGKLKQPLEAPRRDLKEQDRKPVPASAGAGPGRGWTEPGFDDSWWPRVWGTVGNPDYTLQDSTPWPRAGCFEEWHTICLRGKFVVTDPAKVRDLRLSAGFTGGAVLYVNSKEVRRAYLPAPGKGEGPAGPLAADALAEPYPREAYFGADGKPHLWNRGPVDHSKLRGRSLDGGSGGVAIPSALLRQGVNVVALEVHAAPILDVEPRDSSGRDWPHASVWGAKLTAAAEEGLVPNTDAGPRQGIASANSSPIETVQCNYRAHPSEKLFPVRLVGTRNGTFSGKVVLSSAAAFRLTRATAGDLTREGGSGRIPASAVQVRWAERARPEVSYRLDQWMSLFDRLLSEYPATIATAYSWGSAAPVWVTIRVPAETPAGVYKGVFTVEAEGAGPEPERGAAPAGPEPSRRVKFEVPVDIKVNDWVLPNPRDYVSRNNIYQSTDSVAQYYKVPLWSDRHFELMAKSIEALCALGSRVCTLNLVYNAPGFWNGEGMVRWVKKPGGGYDYDFTIADKYMDLYARIVGKPAMVLLNLWEIPIPNFEKYLPWDPTINADPGVTVLDPATGKTEKMPQPKAGTPESEAFWRPVLAEMRKRLEKRGWFDVTAVCGINHAAPAPPEMVEVCRNIWPDGKWLHCAHQRNETYPGAKGKAPMPVAFCEFIWGWPDRYDPDRAKGLRYTRPRLSPETGTVHFGNMHQPGAGCGSRWSPNYAELAYSRNVCEMMVQMGLAGVGRVGGDFWPLPIGPKGRHEALARRYRSVSFYDNECFALLSPGPDGAILGETAEAFREGVQLVEAILYLQRAVDSKAVPAALAARIEALLDERARYQLRSGTRFLAFESSPWQDRDDRLFALCAEAAATMERRKK